MIVCDEAHTLKNPKSGLSKALNAIRTPYRIALTGTPLQNNLTEYHTMISFVRPGLIGDRLSFEKKFAKVGCQPKVQDVNGNRRTRGLSTRPSLRQSALID